jgi:hypothetical protein
VAYFVLYTVNSVRNGYRLAFHARHQDGLRLAARPTADPMPAALPTPPRPLTPADLRLDPICSTEDARASLAQCQPVIDAGGIDAFVSEVYAEAVRQAGILDDEGPTIHDEVYVDLVTGQVEAVIWRRFASSIRHEHERLYRDRFDLLSDPDLNHDEQERLLEQHFQRTWDIHRRLVRQYVYEHAHALAERGVA